MSCEFVKQVALYADDELDRASNEKMAAHLRGCTECTAALASHLDLKKAVRVGGKRFSAPPELHAAIFKQVRRREGVSPWWKWGLLPLTVVLLAAIAFLSWPQPKADTTIAGLVDQHISMLATNHLDVISEDRHTVKPWYQGKVPFTFNSPDLANSPFKLIGGNLVYAQQKPGAELVYTAGLHKVSVFIFQANSREEGPVHKFRELSFNCMHWQQNGLEFYMLTDAQDEANQLANMLRDANRS